MLTIIMCNPRLEHLSPRKSCLCRVRYNVDQCDSIQSSELFEISISSLVPVHVLYRQSKVSSIGVGLEDVTPEGVRPFGHGHMQEDGVSA